MRIMGLDFGSKTVGVAVSDSLLLTAQGVEIIRRKDENKLRQTLARIEELIVEYEVEEIVLGQPKHMNATEGIRVELDLRNEKIGYKLREARNERDSYICVIGEKEAEANTLSVRSSKEGELGEMDVDTFIKKLVEEIKTKAM